MDILGNIRTWNRVRQTRNELNSLSNRELDDLGILVVIFHSSPNALPATKFKYRNFSRPLLLPIGPLKRPTQFLPLWLGKQQNVRCTSSRSGRFILSARDV